MSIGPGEFNPAGEDGYCDSICDCIGENIERMADAQEEIRDILDERMGKLCENIDECIEDIITALKERLEQPARSCDECSAMVASGLAGTLEYAVACAGRCEEEEYCPIGVPKAAGVTCKKCGKEPCCCDMGECVPCEEQPEEEKKHQYYGFCNPTDGHILVLRDDKQHPGLPWVQVTLNDTEEAAVAAATANCEQFRIPVERTTTKAINVPPSFQVACNLSTYQTPSALRSMAHNLGTSLRVGGVAQYLNAVGDLGIGGITIENIGEIINAWFKGTFETQADYITKVVPGLASVVGCPEPGWSDLVYTLANLGHAQKFIGLDLGEFYTQYKYAMHAMCRQKYLDPDKAIAAYFGNAIDDGQLDTMWAIHGLCPDALQWYKYAARAKPTPLHLAVMRHRKLISPSDYHVKMRELGFLEPATAENEFAITYQVPTMTDITRLMVRDADDDSIEFWPESDRIFTQKFGGKLRKWAEDQGIPEEFFKLYWRAHWSIPSPGQLFEFWHRLRHNPDFGGKEQLLRRIKEALIQQDILPAWHDEYLAVSYRPMFRRDIRRAFEIGAITEDEVTAAYIQLGHSDEVAKTLTDYVVRLRDRAVRNHAAMKLWRSFAISRDQVIERLTKDGIPQDVIEQALGDVEQSFDKSPYATAFAKGDISRQSFVGRLRDAGVSQEGASKIADRVALRVRNHPAIKGYQAGALTRTDALSQMTSFGMNTDLAMTRLDEVDADVQYSLLQRCQNGIKHRYLHGEMDKGDALRELANRGTVQDRAKLLVDEWDCEKSTIGRSVPTATLCDLLERGVITIADFTERLQRIGYTEESAGLVANNCLNAISERRKKQAEREQREARQEADRIAKAQARAEAAAKREADKMQREREKAAATRRRRERQLISAAEKVHDACECDLYAAIGAVRVARDHITQTYGLDSDSTLVVLMKAAEAMEVGSLESYQVAADVMAHEAATVPATLN